MKAPKPPLDACTLRELAVLAEADPRTIVRVLRGEHARGLALDRRIRRVLAERGFAAREPRAAARSYATRPEL